MWATAVSHGRKGIKKQSSGFILINTPGDFLVLM